MLDVGSPKVESRKWKVEIAEGYWLEAENRKIQTKITK